MVIVDVPQSIERRIHAPLIPNRRVVLLGSTDLLKAGTQLGEPELLFEKIEDEVIERQLQKLADTKKDNKEMFSCLMKLIGLRIKLRFKYNKAKNDFISRGDELKSLDFWKKYLELN